MRRGSSLILVLLVIAGVVSAVVITERVALVQSGQVQSSADDTYAYNAAKAGIEDGLLRYRYNRNVETGTLNGDPAVYRFDLSTGQPVGSAVNSYEVDSSTTPFSGTPKDEYYDLQVNYKTSQVNINPTTDTPAVSTNSVLSQNQGATLTGFDQNAPTYYLGYYFVPTNCTDKANFSVQVQENFNGQPPLEIHLTPNSTDSSGNSIINNINATNTGGPLIDITGGSPTVSSVTFLPLGCDVEYAFQSVNSNGTTGPTFDSLTTTITSTGYYGNAQRKLIATINRTTGQLIGVYDFTAYAGTGSISSP